MKVLVTGANGFLGSAVVRHLLDTGYSVKALIHKEHKPDVLEGLSVEKVRVNITHPKAVEEAMKGCSVVLHLASIYTFYPWWEKQAKALYKVNVDGTRNVLAAALKHKVERFIFTSSVASIGKRSDNKPSDEETEFNLYKKSSHYARSKVFAEQEVLRFCKMGLPALILNPAALIGERDYKPTPTGEMIVQFLNQAYPGYFEAAVSVADVDDVARAHVAAITKGKIGERYILCDSKTYTLEELFSLMAEIAGLAAPRLRIPYGLLIAILYIDEALAYFIIKKKPLLSTGAAEFCRMSISFNNNKAVKELGYKVTPIKETLTKAINWYRENGYIRT